VVPLLRNDQGKHCYIRGNEYVPLLESRQPLAEQRIYAAMQNLVTDSNVSYATQQGKLLRCRYNHSRRVDKLRVEE
jgi:hypothetical protein